MNIMVNIAPESVTIALKRDVPALSWPYGELLEWERFSFPSRIRGEVLALAEECSGLSYTEARELIRSRRREVLWASKNEH
jgi:hypothetical protein